MPHDCFPLFILLRLRFCCHHEPSFSRRPENGKVFLLVKFKNNPEKTHRRSSSGERDTIWEFIRKLQWMNSSIDKLSLIYERMVPSLRGIYSITARNADHEVSPALQVGKVNGRMQSGKEI